MPPSIAIVEECEFPTQSVLHPGFVERAYFHDSYRTSLAQKNHSATDIFLGIFAHRSIWMKMVMVVRNRLASAFGIEAPSVAEIINPEIKSNYSVGEKIGAWPIFSLSASELVAGRDNSHLDFRLSILRVANGDSESVVVSTVCRVHNTFGKVYLFFVVPFHRWGVRRLLKSAGAAGQL